jgi:pentatricopeptide repeat protein
MEEQSRVPTSSERRRKRASSKSLRSNRRQAFPDRVRSERSCRDLYNSDCDCLFRANVRSVRRNVRSPRVIAGKQRQIRRTLLLVYCLWLSADCRAFVAGPPGANHPHPHQRLHPHPYFQQIQYLCSRSETTRCDAKSNNRPFTDTDLSANPDNSRRPRPQYSNAQHRPKRRQNIKSHHRYNNQATVIFNQQLLDICRKKKEAPASRIKVAVHAQQLLEEQMNAGLHYDVVSFNIVMQAWARQHSWTAAQNAENLLSRLLCHSTLQADSYSYAAVLHAYAKSGNQVPAAQRAQALLSQLLTQSTAGAVTLTTDICHNAVMDAWAVSGHPQAGEKAVRLLQQLEQHPVIQPTRISYNACIKAYAKSGQAPQAQALLERMRTLSALRDPPNRYTHLAPDKVSLTTCIDAWAKAPPSATAAASAEALLSDMEECYQRTGDTSIRPDIVSYTSVLAAAARNGMPSHMALELLSRMERCARERPNAAFLNTWIHLLAKTNTGVESLQAAEDILAYMKRAYRNGNDLVQPCKITYTAVIAVLAQTGTIPAAQRASELLDELQGLWEEAHFDKAYLPTAKTFASVLRAWATSNAPDSWTRAKSLLDRMDHLYAATNSDELKPSSIVFAQLFQILSRSRDSQTAARQARDLLQRMSELQKSGNHQDVQPDASTMAYFLNTLTKAGVDNVVELATVVLNEVEDGYAAGMGHLKPTSLLYSAVLQAYAKSASKEGAELAEALLHRTRELYRQGTLYAKPNVLFYNAVIDAHARSNGGSAAAERAELLLDEMETRSRAGDLSLRPTTRSFNAAIFAWKKSCAAEAPQRAEALLKRMNKRYEAGDERCRPDRITLNSIIGVWAKSRQEGAAKQAEEYLGFMESLYEGGDETFKADLYSFNSCIDAFARQGDVKRATALFDRIKSRYEDGDTSLKPNAITLTSLRNAWSNSQDSEDKQRELNRIDKLLLAQQGDGSRRRSQAVNKASAVVDLDSSARAVRSNELGLEALSMFVSLRRKHTGNPS